MTSNELAQQFNDKGLNGQYVSARQGDWLFDLANKEGSAESRGFRQAWGEINGTSWSLIRESNPSRWIFRVGQGRM